MPLKVRGKVPGQNGDELLQRLDLIWAEAVVQAEVTEALERKVAKQDAWLEANRDHPKYHARCLQWRITKAALERERMRMHALASEANRITEAMDGPLRERAVQLIHEWAGIGGVGIYATYFQIVPSPVWFETAAAEAAEIAKARGYVEVPF